MLWPGHRAGASRGAKGWELRASISLARFLCQLGQPGAGQDLLAPVFESFSEVSRPLICATRELCFRNPSER